MEELILENKSLSDYIKVLISELNILQAKYDEICSKQITTDIVNTNKNPTQSITICETHTDINNSEKNLCSECGDKFVGSPGLCLKCINKLELSKSTVLNCSCEDKHEKLTKENQFLELRNSTLEEAFSKLYAKNRALKDENNKLEGSRIEKTE